MCAPPWKSVKHEDGATPYNARMRGRRGLAGFALGLLAVAVAGEAATLQMQVRARAVQPGEVVRLIIDTGEPLDEVHVRAFGQEVPVARLSPIAWESLLGIDLDVKPGTHEVTVEASAPGRRHATSLRLEVTARRFPTRRLRVAETFVNPPPDTLARIETEAVELNAFWALRTLQRYWDGPFTAPVPTPANSAFGSRSVFNGEPRQPHAGADFPSPTGAPIASPSGGRVVLARDLYFTGNTVVLDHGLGLVSLFAHLSAIDVRVGDRVVAGQRLGQVGATGRVTGPHLHWSVRLNGARVDPLSLIAALEATDGRQTAPSPRP